LFPNSILLTFIEIKKIRDMYSLNCDYFVEEFSSLEKLLYYVMQVGMDPNYEITRNGKGTGEMLSDLIADCY
jgi:hypothetical protein